MGVCLGEELGREEENPSNRLSLKKKEREKKRKGIHTQTEEEIKLRLCWEAASALRIYKEY